MKLSLVVGLCVLVSLVVSLHHDAECGDWVTVGGCAK